MVHNHSASSYSEERSGRNFNKLICTYFIKASTYYAYGDHYVCTHRIICICK